MAEQTLITPEMAEAVGRDYEWTTSYPIETSDIRRWAIAMYYPAPPPSLYWDEAHARSTRWGGIVAPEEFNPFAWMRAEPRGDMGFDTRRPWPELRLGARCPDFRANIFAGTATTYTATRMRPGDVITSVLSLVGYEEKPGRVGLMLFTTTENRWTNQDGERVRTARSVLIRYL